jgi:hypothetical protein
MSERLHLGDIFALACSAIGCLDPVIFGLPQADNLSQNGKLPAVFKKRKRRRRRRTVLGASTWVNVLLHGDFNDESSIDSEKFRRLNRIPFAMFQKIVTLADEWFPQGRDVSGKLGAPNNLLVIFLRVMRKLRISLVYIIA